MKNVRFCRQRDKYSCIPIGLLNVMKWCGIKCSYKNDFKRMFKECKTSKSTGSNVKYFYSVLKRNLKGYAKVEYIELFSRQSKFIEKNLKDEKHSILVISDYSEEHSHTSFWYRQTEHFFFTINLFLDKTYAKINKRHNELKCIKSCFLITKI